MLKILDYIDPRDKNFIEANNIIIGAEKISINRCEITGSVLYFISNKKFDRLIFSHS